MIGRNTRTTNEYHSLANHESWSIMMINHWFVSIIVRHHQSRFSQRVWVESHGITRRVRSSQVHQVLTGDGLSMRTFLGPFRELMWFKALERKPTVVQNPRICRSHKVYSCGLQRSSQANRGDGSWWCWSHPAGTVTQIGGDQVLKALDFPWENWELRIWEPGAWRNDLTSNHRFSMESR